MKISGPFGSPIADRSRQPRLGHERLCARFGGWGLREEALADERSPEIASDSAIVYSSNDGQATGTPNQ